MKGYPEPLPLNPVTSERPLKPQSLRLRGLGHREALGALGLGLPGLGWGLLAASSVGAVLPDEEMIDVQAFPAFLVAQTLEQILYLPLLLWVEPMELDHEDLRKPL